MPEMKTRGRSSRLLNAVVTQWVSEWLLCCPLACPIVHRDRQLGAHLRVHVSWRAALRVGQAEAAQPDLGGVLRLGRHLELDLPALQSRRGDLASLQGNVQRDGY